MLLKKSDQKYKEEFKINVPFLLLFTTLWATFAKSRFSRFRAKVVQSVLYIINDKGQSGPGPPRPLKSFWLGLVSSCSLPLLALACCLSRSKLFLLALDCSCLILLAFAGPDWLLLALACCIACSCLLLLALACSRLLLLALALLHCLFLLALACSCLLVLNLAGFCVLLIALACSCLLLLALACSCWLSLALACSCSLLPGAGWCWLVLASAG